MFPDVLRGRELFDQFSDTTRESLRAAARPCALACGEVLFRQDDRADAAYLIREGKIKITTRTESCTPYDRRETLLSLYGPGNVLGEDGICDGGRQPVTATAVTDCVLDRVARADLEAIMMADASAERVLAHHLARRLHVAKVLIATNSDLDVPTRTALTILILVSRFGEPTSTGVYVYHGLTQTELASMMGASREAFNKAITEFARRSWIRIATKSFVALDLPRLTARAGLAPDQGPRLQSQSAW